MSTTFKNKPKSMAAYAAIIGSFSPNTFQPKWFAEHGMISASDAENLKNSSVKNKIGFRYCRFEARTDVLVFETDQLGYIPQTLDLLGSVLSFLKDSTLQRIEAHIQTHYDIGDGSAFIGKVVKNQFWEDIVGGNYEYSGIEIKIPDPKNPKLDAAVFLEVCPSNGRQIHINVKDSVFMADNFSKEISPSIVEDIKSSFNNSVGLINKVRNYEF